MQCKCGAPIDWGRLCDSCIDSEKIARLMAPADTSRCIVCGAFKWAPGHSEFICIQRAMRRDYY